ncbi:hypothetical protein [Butyrivibrio sp. AE3009]|uniref:hypothetical protein n=1 Tax=Butyrivibrio sp. AE3009 TaxID=1280666 RepID=UPI0003B51BCE|nr:hypothetical protein [Butyrivibrio sp. AE3009]
MTNEEYLDSLLNNVQSNNKDPKSALNRMSTKGSSDAPSQAADEEMASLVQNSNGNEDLNEIGSLLNKLEDGEFVDGKMADLLDEIESLTDVGIPKFTVGNEPSHLDVRDPEEIALDEAIADAERMDAEIQSGKFADQSFSDAAENAPSEGGETSMEDIIPPAAKPLVDIEDGDDALMEMAPEVIIPEDNAASISKDIDSDAGQTPEEILTDLLDDMPGDNLSDPEMGQAQDSLSDVLDNIQDEEPMSGEESLGDLASLADLDINELSPESLEQAMDEGIIPEEEAPEAEVQEAPAESIPDADMSITEEVPAEDTPVPDTVADDQVESLDDIMAGMAELGLDMGEDAANEAAPDGTSAEEGAVPDAGEVSDEAILDDMALDELTLDDMSMDDLAEEPAADAAGEEAQIPSEGTEDAGLGDDIGFTFDGGDPTTENGGEAAEEDDFNLESMEKELNELDAGTSKATDPPDEGLSLDDVSADFNLNDLEASLDDLLSGEEGSGSAEGEVAEVQDGETDNTQAAEEGSGDTAMPDLDALMNSLASDDIEDLENEAAREGASDAGDGQEEDVPKEDILDALTEDGFGDLGTEPSLEDLAAIPESAGGTGKDAPEDKKGKKKKKGGLKALLASIFTALTREDEEIAPNGELASLTDENQQVLNELGDEKPKKEKKKKEKKPKKEKPKKEPKPKKEKPPKPKKEKKPKPPKDPSIPEKAISPRKVAISFIFAASLGILVLIPSLVLPERLAKERAESAYIHQDYVTTYKVLHGKELDERQTLMYEQSRVLAWGDRYLTAHENFEAMNMKEEALDILLTAMRNKEDILEEAAQFNVEIQIESVYSKIESLLLEEYGLTEEDVKSINSIKKDWDYTIKVMEIVGTLKPVQ